MEFLTATQITTLAENGYVIVDNWLSPRFLNMARNEFEQLFNAGAFKKAQTTQKLNQMSSPIRGDWTYWLDSNLPPQLSAIHNELLGWTQKLNKQFYLGLSKLECHLAHYPPGPGYERHLDQPKGRGHRKITFVLYLNSDWNAQMGGELCLYSPNSDQQLEKILPLGGRLILFKSELFPHEVLPSQNTRRSLTGWFRNDAV